MPKYEINQLNPNPELQLGAQDVILHWHPRLWFIPIDGLCARYEFLSSIVSYYVRKLEIWNMNAD